MIIRELEHNIKERMPQRFKVAAADEKSADSKTCPLPLHAFI